MFEFIVVNPNGDQVIIQFTDVQVLGMSIEQLETIQSAMKKIEDVWHSVRMGHNGENRIRSSR